MISQRQRRVWRKFPLGNTEEALAELAQRMPTGRLAEPEDIADVIVFLATDDARHIIGQLIHVNGGDYLA
jgi:NAD(P)-dependent dehydrogenase (short-subunit alcohol dehydrogenase family)